MSFAARRAAAPTMRVLGQQTRGMATEKQILMRINATSNIAKITKSMKMVSTAKMRGADQRLTAGRPFADFLDRIGGSSRQIDRDGLIPAEELKDKKHVFVVVSSDRGLCGGVNSGVAKVTRKQVHELPNTQLFIVGDKGRGQLRRDLGKLFRGNVTEAYAAPPSFTLASAIAEAVLSGAPVQADGSADPEHVHIIYNTYVSAIAYLPTIRTLSITPDTKAFAKYELEPDNEEELLRDMREFEAATAIYHAIIENMTSEESSRMAAMENATTNAEELISNLTLIYNKARQSRITTELIEIISGAASLEED